MSVRTFTRRFRAATGAAPIEWLIRLRVRRAQDLLETTDAPIDTIARRAGFGAPETLRHHFRKVVGTSPSAWRNSFRGKARTCRAKQNRRRKGAGSNQPALSRQELALSTVTERRFCDQHEMSLHTATGRSLP